jgi:uncharacterized protein
MRFLDGIALILVVIGAINWGIIGFFGFNVVEAIFGIGVFSAIIYILVGLGGLYAISFFARDRRRVHH